MNAEELYQHMKDALSFFGLSFHQKSEMDVKFKDNQIIFTYDNLHITIQL